jgi:hypothetical protein
VTKISHLGPDFSFKLTDVTESNKINNRLPQVPKSDKFGKRVLKLNKMEPKKRLVMFRGKVGSGKMTLKIGQIIFFRQKNSINLAVFFSDARKKRG